MTAAASDRPSTGLRKSRGAAAESMAVAYLELRGYRILARNWRDGPREIDIIVEVGRLVAFIEVKFRASDRFGGARLALRPQQRLDLERAAVAFLKSAGRSDRSVRFDLVGIEFDGEDGLRLAHLKGAYGASRRFYL
ncbi:MAG: YraN family protein [Candidatus Eisenbacteria bacterium]|nr:YraN family protein [Candidatus Eisenbacteria bacterium]